MTSHRYEKRNQSEQAQPAKTVFHLPADFSRFWMDSVDENPARDEAIEEYAEQRELDSDEYLGEVTDHLRSLVERGEIAIAASADALISIVESGRVKSQFETGTSAGLVDDDNHSRAWFESEAMDYDYDTAPEDRPLYGFITENPDKTPMQVKGYGVLSLVLKPEVRSRSSVTFGDSYNHNTSFEDAEMAPMKIGTEDDFCYPFADSRFPDPLNISSVDEMGVSAYGGGVPVYVEAQIHGGVSVDDIERVVIYKEWATEEEIQNVTAALDAASVPYSIS